MKKGLLEKVQADYKKRGELKYDSLYKLYELVPYKFKEKIEYSDEDDGLWFDGKFIGDLTDLEISRSIDTEETFDCVISFTRNDEKEFMCLWFKHSKNEEGKWGWHTYQLGDWDSI